MKHGDAIAHLTRQIARARRALALERAVPLALPAAAALALWLSASLLGVHGRLPPLGGSLLTILALASVAALGVLAATRYRSPTAAEARVRLERDNGHDPGALAPLDDSPASLDPLGLALWRREQERARARAAKAAAGPPRVRFGAADRYGLRWAALLVLVAAAIYAGPQAPGRIAAALFPDPGPLVGDGPIAIEAWAAPAAYTGAAPVSLSDRSGQIVVTAPSIEVTARVTGPVGAPRLVFEGRPAGFGFGRRIEAPFVRAADGAWEAKLDVPGPGTLKIVRFHTKAEWRLRPGKDAPPAIRFLEPPVPQGDGLAFAWTAEDDFGVRAVALHVTPVSPPPGLAADPAHETPLESPGAEPKTASDGVEIDLAAHPYAGLEVEARMIVRDALGQRGLSDPVRVKLPERVFLQPLARAALEARKAVLWERRPYAARKAIGRNADPFVWAAEPVLGAQRLRLRTDDVSPRIERAPAGIWRAVRLIDALTMRPEDGYFADPAVYAGLELARATLRMAGEIDETAAAADILWEVAQRAEYGDAADLKKALENAQRALSEAIRRGAPPDEIARLSEALRRATQDYMQALVQEAIREGRTAENREDSQEQQQNSLSQADIQEMLREVERLAKEGRQEEAQALLQQLNEMLANMEVQLASGPSESGDPAETELNETIEGLSDAMREQRALRDETQRESEENAGPQDAQRLAERQQQLQRQLEEAREGAEGQQGQGQGQGQDEGGTEGLSGQTPEGEGQGEGQGGEGRRQALESLDRAGRAMGEAERALRDQDLQGASRAQDEALRQLRAGSEQLGRELLSRQNARQQRPGGVGREQERDNAEGDRDPLGRPMGATGRADGDEATVPDGASPERAREILDELRRRAQDPRRPESEREYLRRLLERFGES